MIERVISGGQTGADQAGWRAAKRFGIPTGGYMPHRFKTEDGSQPQFALEYGAKEFWSFDYPPRTRENVKLSDVTLWFGTGDSLGLGCTLSACRDAHRPFWKVDDPDYLSSSVLASMIGRYGYKIVNVAGNRESKAPGIGAWVEDYLDEVFETLGHRRVDVQGSPAGRST